MTEHDVRGIDGVDDVDWALLEDAYGAAVELPRRLRALAAGGDDWETCLDELYAGIYHQGSYYTATAVAAGFLVAMVGDVTVPHRHRILAFLAALSGGHDGDTEAGWDPYTFRSSPAAPTYPEALAAIDAVMEGMDTYQRILADDEPLVRAAAAHLLAGIAGHDPTALRALENALRVERDVGARASMLLAMARLSTQPLPLLEAEAPPLVRASVAVGNAWQGRFDHAALVEAAILEPTADFAWSAVSSLAVAALGRLDDRAPLLAVMRVWLERGGKLYSFHEDHNDWADTAGPTSAEWHRDELLRAAMSGVAPQVFHAFVDREEPIAVAELNDEQREILRWTVDYGIAVPLAAIPWIDAPSMERFLAGNGPLDRRVCDRPLWRWLYGVGDGRVEAHEVDLVIEGVRHLEPEAIFDICTDIIAEAYAHPRRFDPTYRATEQRIFDLLVPHRARLLGHFKTYADRLVEEPRHNVKLRGAQLVVPALRALGDLGAEHDLLVGMALSLDESQAAAEVASIPEPRRSVMVGRMTSSNRRAHIQQCDALVVARETVSRFLDPGCRTAWFQMEELLRDTGAPGCDAITQGLTQATGRKRKLLGRVLADLTGHILHVEMLVALHDEGLHITLRQDDHVLAERNVPREPTEADIAPLGDLFDDPRLVHIEVSLDPSLNDQRFRMLDLAASLGARETSLTGGPSQRRL